MSFQKLKELNLLSKSGKLPELDGIRGMAFLLVALTHMTSPDAPLLPFTDKLGVWLFFILSSFLLSSYFLAAPDKTKDLWEWANYIVRRFLRVYPLYVLVLLFYYFFFPIGEINSGNLANHFLLNDGVNHFWTIPVEIHFYFVLPIIVLVIVYVLRRSILWTGLALAGSTFIFPLLAPSAGTKEGHLSLVNYLPIFITGCFLATVYNRTKDLEFTRKQRLIFDAAAIAVLLGIALTYSGFWEGFFSNDFQQYFTFYGFAWAAFVWFVIHGVWVKKFFVLPFMRIWGVISYSGYLTHLLIVMVVAFYQGQTYFAALLDFLIIFPVSLLLHVIIERPSTKVNLLKLRARLRGRKPEEKPASVATTVS